MIGYGSGCNLRELCFANELLESWIAKFGNPALGKLDCHIWQSSFWKAGLPNLAIQLLQTWGNGLESLMPEGAMALTGQAGRPGKQFRSGLVKFPVKHAREKSSL